MTFTLPQLRIRSGLSYVRVDACRSDPLINPPPTISSSKNAAAYTMQNCSSFSVADITANSTNLLGTEGEFSEPFPSSYTPSGLVIDLNGNTGGSITFRITAMDNAGNFIYRDVVYALGEWAITTDGLVYGANGVSSTTRKLEDGGVWSGSKLLTPPFSFLPLEADLTDQVLLGGNSSVTSFLGTLERYTDNQSFKAANFPGVYITSPYEELLMAYNAKKENPLLSYQEVQDPSISENLTALCSGDPKPEYCIVNNLEDTTITDFVCDGKGLIMANGDITITPNITNSSESDACIFVSSGDIIINEGDDGSGYDSINAYLIANGKIIINSDSNNDGLIIEGGLAAFGPTDTRGIENSRQIEVLERNAYPVLAVNNNAKYGLLSKILFGSQIDIFKVEVGFKPY